MTGARPTVARLARRGLRAGMPLVAAAMALATARCGLFVSPGEYSSGADEVDGSADDASSSDATTRSEVAVLPDGNVVPGSIGTLALMAGERQPTSAEDDPAWSADAWSGVLGADGRVTSWRIEKSAPIVGSFEAAGLVGGSWLMINTGFGLAGTRGVALQQTSWAPGVVGDWRASRANGAPGGLDETVRVFAGAHVLYIGGTRTNPGVDGGPATTFFTKEVHASDIDATKNELAGSEPAGVSLVVARSRPGVLVTATSVYVVGGRFSGGISNGVEAATIDLAAGTIAAFAEQPAMTSGAADHRVFLPQVAEAGGYLFVAGGRISGPGAPTDVVLSAKINADSSLGAFQSVTSLPKALRDFAFVGFKGRLYVAGGSDGTMRTDEVYSATVDADGKLGAWDASNAKLPGARSDFVTLAY